MSPINSNIKCPIVCRQSFIGYLTSQKILDIRIRVAPKLSLCSTTSVFASVLVLKIWKRKWEEHHLVSIQSVSTLHIETIGIGPSSKLEELSKTQN